MSESIGAQTGRGGHRKATEVRRERVVDAVLDLVLERGAPPTTEEVSQRSGVSPATLFRYFATLDELHRATTVRAFERFPTLFRVPKIGRGPLDERIARYCALRVEMLEKLHPLVLVERRDALGDPDAQEMIDAGAIRHARTVERHFANELRVMTPTRRGNTIAAICVLTSVESWQQYRRSHERSPLQTRRAWADAIARLLGDD